MVVAVTVVFRTIAGTNCARMCMHDGSPPRVTGV
jgi:hypothetical protein